MKRCVAILVIVVALASGCRARPAAPVTVQLIAINDFHGNLAPPEGSNGRVGNVPAGGAEYLATHVKAAVARHPNSLVVGAGDIIGASPLMSGLFHDAPTIEAMNALGLAVTSVGNHEFDHGLSDLLRAQRDAHFQYLAANVVAGTASQEETVLPATAVRTVGGVRIGFIGEVLQDAGQMVSPARIPGLRFLDEAGAANASAAALERQGVHAIVLLIHQGGRQHPAQGPVDPNRCDAFSGPIDGVMAKLSPAITVIVSGHTHEYYNCEIDGRRLTSAGSFGRLFTRITLSIDPVSDTITRADARNEIVTRTVAKDPTQTAIVEQYTRMAAPVANAPVGSITDSITRTLNVAGESAMGDVIADAQLAAASAPAAGGAVVAFMNEGGVRADLAAPAGPRDITYGELYTIQPFGDTLTVVTMTGDMIRRLLEQQFRGSGKPPFLQVSHGFTYRYRLNAPAGEHVVPGSITLGGRKIASADRVRVEASDFLAAGGDGFTVFGEGADRVGGINDVDALVAYFKSHASLSPGPRNRVVRVD